MRNKAIPGAVLRYMAKGFVILFAVPILSTWFVGSAICAVLAPIGGILRTFGVSGIGMYIGPGYSLPDSLSLPFSLVLAALLAASSFYTRIVLLRCLQFIRA